MSTSGRGRRTRSGSGDGQASETRTSQGAGQLEFSVLGHLRVRTGTTPIDLGPPQRRVVLAVLLSEPRSVIPTDRIIECVWGDDGGAWSRSSVHAHVSHLRRALGSSILVSHTHGYELAVRSELIDADAFSYKARVGRLLVEHGDERGGRHTLREALSLWRGRAYEGFERFSWARREIARLDAERLGALTARIDADLRSGDTDVIGELEAIVVEHPDHDGFCERLMLALYRAGRQADAVAAYHRHVRRLRDVAGLLPAPPLQDLLGRMLRHDPSLNRATR